MILAIGQAVEAAMAAEVEALGARIADRPLAHLVVEREQRHPEADRHDEILERHLRRRAARGGVRLHLERGITLDEGTRRGRPVRRGGAAGAGLARARRARSRLRPAGKIQAVYLADHGIARDAAKLRGDLARAQSVSPEFFEQLDAFVGPIHLGVTLLQRGEIGITLRAPARSASQRPTRHKWILSSPQETRVGRTRRGETYRPGDSLTSVRAVPLVFSPSRPSGLQPLIPAATTVALTD